MTSEEIKRKAKAVGDWYHEIELCPGFTTPSKFAVNNREQWNNIRGVRSRLAYKEKTVLDMGTMDGMWAFEAERLGAVRVYAMDICQNAPMARQRFEIAKEALRSHVTYATMNAHILKHQCDAVSWPKFDIIQCLGLLYHVQNPMLVINNVSASLVGSGMVLCETACIFDKTSTPWMRFNFDRGVYCDPTTYCCPNWIGLQGMFKCCGLDIDESTKSVVPGEISRVAFIAYRNMQPLLPELGMA